MYLTYYEETVKGKREKYLVLTLYQGMKEVKRLLSNEPVFANRNLKIQFDANIKHTQVMFPLDLANASEFATVLYNLLKSDAGGFRADETF